MREVGLLGGGDDPESSLIFHITVTSFSFVKVVCCKVLKVFCGLRSLGMSGICCEALGVLQNLLNDPGVS